MTQFVSIGDLRQNLAAYLAQVSKGVRVIIRDEKKATSIAQLTQVNLFNAEEYERVLRKIAGTLSQKHPEWKNKQSISRWLGQTRTQSDRKF